MQAERIIEMTTKDYHKELRRLWKISDKAEHAYLHGNNAGDIAKATADYIQAQEKIELLNQKYKEVKP